MSSTRAAPSFWPTVIAVAAASAMLPFSVTGTAVALPRMVADLHASIGAAQWVQNGFNVPFAALPLAAGSLADRYGRRRVLLLGITLVGLTSLLEALAPSIGWVDTARVIQGCGAAAVLASGAAVLANATTGRRRQLAFGLLGAAFGAGLAVGPLTAGALVEAGGWRAVFLAIASLSLPVALCTRRAPESLSPSSESFDLLGAATFTAGLACLSFVFVQGATSGWTAPSTLGLLAAAIALVLGFIQVERRRGQRAMFDLRLFRRPEFIAVICQPFTVTLGFVVLLVTLPSYLQGVGGHSTLASGLLLLPLTVPVLVLPLISGRLAARYSLRAVLTCASLLIAAGALVLPLLQPAASWLQLACPLLPFGLGVGLAFGVMDNAALSTVPLQNAGAAAGIFNTMRITGESVAVAGAAALLTTLTSSSLHAQGLDTPEATHLAGQAVYGQLAGAHRQELTHSLTAAFHTLGTALAALSALGALLTFRALSPTKVRPTQARVSECVATIRGMGYTTEFTGHVTITPPLNPAEIAYLRKFAGTRRMDRDNGPYFVDGTGHAGQGHDPDIRTFDKPPAGQPGLWCGWVPTADGSAIEWNRTEKFYDSPEWMTYLIDHFLKPGAHTQSNPGFADFTFNHLLNGTIDAQGEEPWDTWQLLVRDNKVSTSEPEPPAPDWHCESCLQPVADENATCCPGSEPIPVYPQP
ncbi:MFS transporter [Kitasatospora mediocidica]|uniref:MFS transporter n=1 Tax=Kitasatospora mediocidica TaxID=58352 RepID=UPI0007C6EA06|nr:MFS transporter [Kitasatospora mediocidica]